MSKENQSWLSYFNLSDEYERRARFLPGLLTFCFLLPSAPAIGNILDSFIQMLIGGAGVGAVIAIGISHLASAAGNRYQKVLFPRWPDGSPTNRWLHPDNQECSSQQKLLWYKSIKQVTGLDIERAISDSPHEIDVIINDATTSARVKLRQSNDTGLLFKHNIDYGYARNFTGLRYIWLTFSVISAVTSWLSYYSGKGDIVWSIIASVVLVFAIYVAFWSLPSYVKNKADRYAESFFGALVTLTNRMRTANN